MLDKNIITILRIFLLRPNKKINVFQVKGLKIVGRVGTQYFFFWKKYFIYFESLSKCMKFFFSENLKKLAWFTSKFRKGQVTLKTGIFFYLA